MSRARPSLPVTLFRNPRLRTRPSWGLRELDRQKKVLLTIRTLMVISLGLLGFSCAFVAAFISDVTAEYESSETLVIRYSSISTGFLLLAVLAAEMVASMKWNDSVFYRDLEHSRRTYEQ